jgi:proteasome assembly chaperone (PAC2) family protein
MKMWINYHYLKKPEFKNPIAIAASPGLRSVGKIAIEYLLKKLPCKLIAEIYSPHFAVQYIGPSYFGTIGSAGVKVERGLISLPRIEVYASNARELILVRGYQAEYDPSDPNSVKGPFQAAACTLELLQELKVKRLFILASHGTRGKRIFCAATHKRLIEELSKYGIEKREIGEFYGYSALLLGFAGLAGMEGICLFSETSPDFEDLETPDIDAVKRILSVLKQLADIEIDIELEEKEEPLDYIYV